TARIGEAMAKIPGKNVPKAVAALLRRLERGRSGAESLAELARHTPCGARGRLLAPFADEGASDPESGIDWGQSAPFTTGEIGVGEGAGAGTDVEGDTLCNLGA